jgi:hypothetical protein
MIKSIHIENLFIEKVSLIFVFKILLDRMPKLFIVKTRYTYSPVWGFILIYYKLRCYRENSISLLHCCFGSSVLCQSLLTC